MERTPATDIELRAAYGRAGLGDRGISFDEAITSPDLRALLGLWVARARRVARPAAVVRPQPAPTPVPGPVCPSKPAARTAARPFVSRIERTAGEQPDLFPEQDQ